MTLNMKIEICYIRSSTGAFYDLVKKKTGYTLVLQIP